MYKSCTVPFQIIVKVGRSTSIPDDIIYSQKRAKMLTLCVSYDIQNKNIFTS